MLLSPVEAAAALGASVPALARWRTGPAFSKLELRVMYDRAEIDAETDARRAVSTMAARRRVACRLPAVDQNRARGASYALCEGRNAPYARAETPMRRKQL